MSFERRFTGSNDESIFDSPNCFYGPPWCGKCSPGTCLYLMEYAFMPEEELVRLSVQTARDKP